MVEKRPMLSLAAVARRLDVCYDTVHRLVRKGAFSAAKVGGVWRVDPDDLEAFIETQKQAALHNSPTAAADRARRAEAVADALRPKVENPFL